MDKENQIIEYLLFSHEKEVSLTTCNDIEGTLGHYDK